MRIRCQKLAAPMLVSVPAFVLGSVTCAAGGQSAAPPGPGPITIAVRQALHNGQSATDYASGEPLRLAQDAAPVEPTSAAQEQTTASSARDEPSLEPLQEVVVTGSLIKRPNANSQLVTVITPEEIQRRGATNATEILSAISQNQPIETPNTFAAGGSGLASYASLRSLGSEGTLVLVNSKRVVNDPFANKAADLNTIPVALIERVDTLSDGASSIYGSDAIAGVINFIMKEEFQGVQVSANAFQPEAPGGQAHTFSATVGMGSLAKDHWNFYVGGMYRKSKLVRALDRDFSRTGNIPERNLFNLNTETFPMNVFQSDGASTLVSYLNPFFPMCNPPVSYPNANPAEFGQCLNDNFAENFIQNPQEQKSVITKLSHQFGDTGPTASLEYFRAESIVTSAISSVQFYGDVSPVALTEDESVNGRAFRASPYFPGAGITPDEFLLENSDFDPTRPVTAVGRFPTAGPRATSSESYTDRVLGRFTGDVAGIDYEFWGMHSKSNVQLVAKSAIFRQEAVDDVFSGLDLEGNEVPMINPWGESDPGVREYLDAHLFQGVMQEGTGTLKMAGLQLNRDLFSLPGGNASGALGFEFGKDSLDFHTIPEVINFELVGFASSSAAGSISASRKRRSVTAEVLMPVTSQLELDISARQDHYSDFGSSINPKILATYRMLDNKVSMHGSFNTGFRAPTLFELYRPETLGFSQTFINDPILCPGGIADDSVGGDQTLDCNTKPTTREQANPDLDPIESRAFAVGIDFAPMPGLSFGIDYWNYKVDKIVGVVSTQTIFENLDKYGSFVHRCADSDIPQRFLEDPDLVSCLEDGSTQNRPGANPIAYIDQQTINIGETNTDGFDLGLNWAHEFGFGTLAFDYRGTYVTKYEFRETEDDPVINPLGVFALEAPVIKYSHYASINWDKGAWGVQLTNRLVGGYTDDNFGFGRNRQGLIDHVNLIHNAPDNAGNPYTPAFQPGFFNHVEPYSLWNLSASYKHGDQWTVTALVRNLFDTDPPFSNKTGGIAAGYDERLTDAIGRSYGLTFSMSLWGAKNSGGDE